MAAGFAGTAWQGSQNDERTMKRVIRAVEQLPINSNLDSVMLPYFAITKLDWIKDPTTQLTQGLLQSIAIKSNWNPFNSSYNPPGTFALVPENWDALTPPASPYSGIISETRLLVGRYGPGLAKPRPSCSRARPFGDLPEGIGIYPVPQTPASNTPYAWVIYEAGAARCKNCRISSWLTCPEHQQSHSATRPNDSICARDDAHGREPNGTTKRLGSSESFWKSRQIRH